MNIESIFKSINIFKSNRILFPLKVKTYITARVNPRGTTLKMQE